MTNPTPRRALRKAEDAEVHPAAPHSARTRRAPAEAPTAAPSIAQAPAPAVVAIPPMTIADTNVAAHAAAARREKKAKTGPAPAVAPATPPAKPRSKKRKFSGSTSDHLRMPDTEFIEHPKPTAKSGTKPHAPKPHAPKPGNARGSRPATTPAPTAKGTTDATSTPGQVGPEVMSGKTVELDVLVPKKLRKAARDEAKRRGLDLDAVTSDLLYAWLTEPR